MKRVLALLLSATLLLSACGKEDSSKKKKTKATTTTTVTTTTEATTTTVAPEPEIPEIEYTLLDGKKAINDEGNLIDCEVEVLSEFSNPYLYYYKDYIVFFESVHDFTEEIEISHIAIVSLADGKLIAQKKFDEYGYCELVVSDDNIAIHSYDKAKLYFLDDSLAIDTEYDISSIEDGLVLFTRNLKEIYSVMYNKGLMKLDLESGKEELVYASKNISIDGFSDSFCFFSIVSPETYLNEHYLLDCETGVISETDFKNTGFINKSGNLIVYSNNVNNDEKFVRYNGVDKIILNPVSYLRTTTYAEKILLTDYGLDDVSYTCMYEPDGTFISKFQNSIDTYFTTDYVYYNDKYDGYFLTLNSEEGSKLVFWDTTVKVEGNNLLVDDIFEPEEIVADVSDKIRKKVTDMENRYGVDIKVAEECDLSVAGYTFYLENNEDLIYKNLDTIDKCMAKYPEGFFKQIKYGDIDHVEIQILRNMDSPSGVTMDAAAFVCENADTIGVYFGSGDIYSYEVYHEFTHVIDFYLSFKKKANDDILFDDEKWCEFNPEGYVYAESGNNSDIYDLLENYYVEGYFTEPYSCANSMEDRATLMSAAMIKNTTATSGRPLIEKLRYWSKCIRDGFDTTGWDDVVLWEEMLD